MNLKKSILFIFILVMSSYISYDYGHTTGYNDGYFNGSIDGYLTNKYIAHDYANFSAENAVNEEIKLKGMRGNNLSENMKIMNGE